MLRVQQGFKMSSHKDPRPIELASGLQKANHFHQSIQNSNKLATSQETKQQSNIKINKEKASVRSPPSMKTKIQKKSAKTKVKVTANQNQNHLKIFPKVFLMNNHKNTNQLKQFKSQQKIFNKNQKLNKNKITDRSSNFETILTSLMKREPKSMLHLPIEQIVERNQTQSRKNISPIQIHIIFDSIICLLIFK